MAAKDIPEPVLKEGVVYLADNGMAICRKCAGGSALYTGRDTSGQPVWPVPRSMNEEFIKMTGDVVCCERGCTRYDD